MQQKVDTTVDEMMREQEKIGQGIWFLSYEIKIVDYFKFINFNDFKFVISRFINLQSYKILNYFFNFRVFTNFFVCCGNFIF